MRNFRSKHLFGLAFLLSAISAPAFATEWASCGSVDGEANINLLMGTGDMGSIVGITMQIGKEQWSSTPAYGPGASISTGQTFADKGSLLLDLVDDNFGLLASLHVYKAIEGDYVAAGGILHVPGKGAWSVTCDELF